MDSRQEAERKKSQEETLHKAQEAAASGDTDAMIKALYQSFVLDGLSRRIQRKWDSLPFDEVQFILIGAIYILYEAVNRGEKILDVVSYLLKVSDRKATDYWRTRQRETGLIEDLKVRDDHLQGVLRWPLGDPVEEDVATEELHTEKRRLQTIAVARSFIPRLGQTNVQAVMNIILESVQTRRQDISSREIADMLGLSRNTVAMSRKRGFEKLLRILREEGYMDQSFNFTGFEYDEDENGGDEE